MHSVLLPLSFPRPKGQKEHGNKSSSITTADDMQNPTRKLSSSGSVDLQVAGALSPKAKLAAEVRTFNRSRELQRVIKGDSYSASPSTPAGKLGGGKCPEERSK